MLYSLSGRGVLFPELGMKITTQIACFVATTHIWFLPLSQKRRPSHYAYLVIFIGRKTRYAYLAIMEWEEDETVFVGVDKVDLESDDKSRSVVGSVVYGPSITGGEAFFVPSHADPAECDGRLHHPCFLLLGLLCLAHSVPFWSFHTLVDAL